MNCWSFCPSETSSPLPPSPRREGGNPNTEMIKVPPSWERACPASAGDLGRGKKKKIHRFTKVPEGIFFSILRKSA